jgi:hypothetical protein
MNIEKIQERYKQFWKMENETPILLLKGIKRDFKLPKEPISIYDRWCDIEYIIKKERLILKIQCF